MRHGSSLTSGPKKSPLACDLHLFCHLKKNTSVLGFTWKISHFLAWSFALQLSNGLLVPPRCSPTSPCVFFTVLVFYNFDSWKLRRLNLLFFGIQPSKKMDLCNSNENSRVIQGFQVGYEKGSTRNWNFQQKSFHDKSNDESFGTPTRSLPTPPPVFCSFFLIMKWQSHHQRVLRRLKGLRHPRYSC